MPSALCACSRRFESSDCRRNVRASTRPRRRDVRPRRGTPQRESTPFYPRSPYGAAKRSLRPLDLHQLPRGLQAVRLQRHPVQPRVAAAAAKTRSSRARSRGRLTRHPRRPAGRRCTSAIPDARRDWRPRARLRAREVDDAPAGRAAPITSSPPASSMRLRDFVVAGRLTAWAWTSNGAGRGRSETGVDRNNGQYPRARI